MAYAVEVTSMSCKGQVVIPQGIRNSLHLESGTKFVVVADQDGILFKPLQMPDKKALTKLLDKARAFAAQAGITESDVADVIKKERRKAR